MLDCANAVTQEIVPRKSLAPSPLRAWWRSASRTSTGDSPSEVRVDVPGNARSRTRVLSHGAVTPASASQDQAARDRSQRGFGPRIASAFGATSRRDVQTVFPMLHRGEPDVAGFGPQPPFLLRASPSISSVKVSLGGSSRCLSTTVPFSSFSYPTSKRAVHPSSFRIEQAMTHGGQE